MNLEKLNESVGEGTGGKTVTNREGGRQATHKRLLNTENKLRVDGGGGEGKWVMGTEVGTCWDEHWVLHVSQFDNKLYS